MVKLAKAKEDVRDKEYGPSYGVIIFTSKSEATGFRRKAISAGDATADYKVNACSFEHLGQLCEISKSLGRTLPRTLLTIFNPKPDFSEIGPVVHPEEFAFLKSEARHEMSLSSEGAGSARSVSGQRKGQNWLLVSMSFWILVLLAILLQRGN